MSSFLTAAQFLQTHASPRSQVSEPSPQEDRGAVRWEGLEALETLSPGSNVPTPPKPQGPQMEAPSRETPDVPSTKLPAPSLEAPSSDASWDPRALPAGAVSPGIRALSIVPAAPDPARPTEEASWVVSWDHLCTSCTPTYMRTYLCVCVCVNLYVRTYVRMRV